MTRGKTSQICDHVNKEDKGYPDYHEPGMVPSRSN